MNENIESKKGSIKAKSLVAKFFPAVTNLFKWRPEYLKSIV